MATLDIVRKAHANMLRAQRDSELHPRTEENDREFHVARDEWQAACVSFRKSIQVQKGGLELNPPDQVSVMFKEKVFMTIPGPLHFDYKPFEGCVLKRVMHVKKGDNQIREKTVWYTVDKGQLIDMTEAFTMAVESSVRSFNIMTGHGADLPAILVN